jgi:hypothetical protein
MPCVLAQHTPTVSFLLGELNYSLASLRVIKVRHDNVNVELVQVHPLKAFSLAVSDDESHVRQQHKLCQVIISQRVDTLDHESSVVLDTKLVQKQQSSIDSI